MADVMSNEERNHTMDTSGIMGPAGEHIIDSSNVLQAIRECDRKARAWDALEKWFFGDWVEPTGGEYNYRIDLTELRNTMAELLAPPKPKSKLARLKEWMKINGGFAGAVTVESVLSEIDRLEAEYAEKD